MKTLASYHNIIPSCIERVGVTVNEVLSFLHRHFGALDEDTLFEVRVVLNEILLNAIKHGNRGDKAKHVKLSVGVTYNGFTYIVVEDQGEGYDCKAGAACCTHIVDEEDIWGIKESGRGILIVHNLCDKVKVNDKGNKVVILKRLVKQ